MASRIGKMPVELPHGVKVDVTSSEIKVEGPKGTLTQAYKPCVKIDVTDKEVTVTPVDDSREARSCHGLYRQLIHNMVTGVDKGYTINLVINGVGYKAEMKGNLLVLSLGYSTIIEYVVPEGIKISCDGNTKVIVSGIDKQKVGQVAAEIRSLRAPEPYKGKGIKYETETIRRKVGKSSAKK